MSHYTRYPAKGNSQAVIGPSSSVVGTVPVFNNTTGTLLSDTGVSIDGSNNITANGLTLTGTTDSTSRTTGILKVAGGAGIVKNVSIGLGINVGACPDVAPFSSEATINLQAAANNGNLMSFISGGSLGGAAKSMFGFYDWGSPFYCYFGAEHGTTAIAVYDQTGGGGEVKSLIIEKPSKAVANLLWNTNNNSTIGNAAGTKCPSSVYVGTSFVAPVGSAAAPSFTFSGGTGFTDKGMYSPASNTLAFAAMGLEIISLTSLNFNLVQSGAKINFQDGSSLSNSTFNTQNNAMVFSVGGTFVQYIFAAANPEVLIDGSLLGLHDNLHDFGYDGTTKARFKDGYLSGNLYLGGLNTGSNTSTSKIYFGSQATAEVNIASVGDVAVTGNMLDITQSVAVVADAPTADHKVKININGVEYYILLQAV